MDGLDRSPYCASPANSLFYCFISWRRKQAKVGEANPGLEPACPALLPLGPTSAIRFPARFQQVLCPPCGSPINSLGKWLLGLYWGLVSGRWASAYTVPSETHSYMEPLRLLSLVKCPGYKMRGPSAPPGGRGQGRGRAQDATRCLSSAASLSPFGAPCLLPPRSQCSPAHAAHMPASA